MNNENNQPQNEQQDQLAEELKMQSEVEASEQAPIEESKDVITNLLPVMDDFDRAIQADKDKQLSEGIILIHQKLVRSLTSKGLKEMECMGQEFNSDFHEAITMIPVEDEAMKGKIVDVLEKGYSINDTVIRNPKVVVGN